MIDFALEENEPRICEIDFNKSSTVEKPRAGFCPTASGSSSGRRSVTFSSETYPAVRREWGCAMKGWFVPPIVIPFVLVLGFVAYGLFRLLF